MLRQARLMARHCGRATMTCDCCFQNLLRTYKFFIIGPYKASREGSEIGFMEDRAVRLSDCRIALSTRVSVTLPSCSSSRRMDASASTKTRAGLGVQPSGQSVRPKIRAYRGRPFNRNGQKWSRRLRRRS